jgi:hypothetical protein
MNLRDLHCGLKRQAMSRNEGSQCGLKGQAVLKFQVFTVDSMKRLR